jgi:Flp pilus assembly protein TadG
MYSNPYRVGQDGLETMLLCTKRAPVSRERKPRPAHGARKFERGQGLTELAIALPALLLLLLGVLDVGRAYWALVALKDAASEGASYAAFYPTRTTEIKERAAESSNALMSLEPDMFSVEYVDPPTAGQPITVTVTYDFELVGPVAKAIVPGGTLTLRAADTSVIY